MEFIMGTLGNRNQFYEQSKIKVNAETIKPAAIERENSEEEIKRRLASGKPLLRFFKNNGNMILKRSGLDSPTKSAEIG